MSPASILKDLAHDEWERAVLASLAAREQELIDLVCELIAAPTPNPPGDERPAAEIAHEAMDALGFDGLQTVSLAVEDRPNLIASVGSGRPTLLLTGHLDTKPAGDLAAWRHSPHDPRICNGRIYGLGATDMKGAVGAMIHAGAALADIGYQQGTLKLALVADEEHGGRFGTRFLAGRPEVTADAVVVGEPSGIDRGWEFVGIASRGFSCFDVTVRGTQMHSSLSDRLPSVNASVKLAGVITRMAADLRPRLSAAVSGDLRPTVNIGVMLAGGVAYGIYPGEARVGVDVRTVPGMTPEQLRSDVDGLMGQLRAEGSELDAQVSWLTRYDGMHPSAVDPQHPIVIAARSAATSVLGRPVPADVMPAFTDGSYWSGVGLPCIPAFGPGQLMLAHRPNEYVLVDEVLQASRIYALSALRFFAAERTPGQTI